MNHHGAYCVRHAWNPLTQGPCCQCMTGQQKLDYVWKQMREARLSPRDCLIQCPYCLSMITDGKPCCDVVARAMAAILAREDVVNLGMEAAQRN
jgi:hypothetical protein